MARLSYVFWLVVYSNGQQSYVRKFSKAPMTFSETMSMRVLESFRQLWKLKMPFSRTWKVLEKRGFFIMAMEKF